MLFGWLSTLWEWRSLLGWIALGVAAVVIFGGLRPVISAVAKTWEAVAIPILGYLARNPYARAVTLGGLAFLTLVIVAWLADGRGYKRATGECNQTIAVRERDAARAELATVKSRLAELEKIRLQDATQSLADAERDRVNQGKTNETPNSTLPCFDESDARRLWGK